MVQSPSKPNAPTDNVPLAIAVIVFAVLALSLGDALIKFTSGQFVLWQTFVLRSLLVVPLLLAYLAVFDRAALGVPPALGWTAVRSLMLVAMWIVYYVALPHLELSIAAAAYYTLPLFITLFSALLIGDKVSPLGWAAVVVGFVGVLLILRPKAGDFNAYALLPLLAAILYALAMILTRTKCRAVNPIMLAVGLNVAFIIIGGIAAVLIAAFYSGSRSGFMFGQWASMDADAWLSMSILAAAILIGSVGAAIAYQKARPSVVGTFDFAYVGFAVFWGLVFFAEVPDPLSVLGMAMIVGAGILSLRQ